MNIDFIKLSPTGNITILVRSPVPRDRQGETAMRLLDRLGGEQVGYIESPADPRAAARLQMMGGEFCGNAAMSLGAVLARGLADGGAAVLARGLADGGAADLALEVSGCAGLVPCRVRRAGDGWRGTVRMPLPEDIGQVRLEADGGPLDATLVRFPGIAHLILPAAAGLREQQLRRRLPDWNRAIRSDALGALIWDEAENAIDPLVYVPSAGTLVREHGCGSGTAAIGCRLAAARGESCEAAVRQSGGVIDVRAEWRDGRVAGLSITGMIRIVAEGSICL